MHKKGRKNKFWKFAASHPEVAYYFLKGEDCFIIFDYMPEDGYQNNLPFGKWDGPFTLDIPSRRCSLTIFGRPPYHQVAEQNFMDRFVT